MQSLRKTEDWQNWVVQSRNIMWAFCILLDVAVYKTDEVKWHRLAAVQGYADAQCKLGYAYSNGEGVSVYHVESVKW